MSLDLLREYYAAMATPPHPIHELAGAFVLINDNGTRTPSHTRDQINDLFYDIRDMFRHAIATTTPASMPEPDMCTTGLDRRGTLYRFRWFDALDIGGKRCGLGVNLHTLDSIGSMWLISFPKLAQGDTPELHPFKAPTIPNKAAWTAYLWGLVKDGTFEKKDKK
jgi:hypothetical protein